MGKTIVIKLSDAILFYNLLVEDIENAKKNGYTITVKSREELAENIKKTIEAMDEKGFKEVMGD